MNRRSFLSAAAAVTIPTGVAAGASLAAPTVPKKISLEEFLAGENPEQRAFWHLKQAAKAMKEYSGAEWLFGLDIEHQAGYLVRE